MVGASLRPAACRWRWFSDLLLRHPDAVKEAGMAIAAHLTDLSPRPRRPRDLAAAAQRGGLRAIRLKAVLMIWKALCGAGFPR
jgi:hypothetical protein